MPGWEPLPSTYASALPVCAAAKWLRRRFPQSPRILWNPAGFCLSASLRGRGRRRYELLHIYQSHVKDQGCVGRDDCRITTLPVGQIWRNAQLALASDPHAGDAFVPALDDLARAQHEVKRMAGTNRAVELLAVGEPAGVIDFDMLSALGDRAGADFDVPVFEAAGGFGGRAGHPCGTAGVGLRRWLVGWSLVDWSRLGGDQTGQREHCDDKDDDQSFHSSPFPTSAKFLNFVSSIQSCSSQRNHINFNQGIFRKPRYFDGGACRGRLLEVAAVDFVHGGEISHVFEEDCAAQNFLKATPRGLQNGSEVFEHAVGLRAHIAADDLRGGGIDGDLSGSKDQALGSNCLRVGADGLRGLLGGDHFAHDSSWAY